MSYYYAEHEDGYRRVLKQRLTQWSDLFEGDTGAAACFLAARGFRVDAVDLIPQAITLARRFARQRGFEVDFGVQDICALADEPVRKRYDATTGICYEEAPYDASRWLGRDRRKLVPPSPAASDVHGATS
jgi:hypothetical protein